MSSENGHIKQYTGADIDAYLHVRMDAAAMHAFERAALEDPFLADALEGYEGAGLSGDSVRSQLLHALASRIPAKNKRLIIPVAFRFAAAVASIVLIISIALLLRPEQTLNPIVATRKEKILLQSDSLRQDSDTSYPLSQRSVSRPPARPYNHNGIADTKAKHTKDNISSTPSPVIAIPKISEAPTPSTTLPSPEKAPAVKRESESQLIDRGRQPVARARSRMGDQGAVSDTDRMLELNPPDSNLKVGAKSIAIDSNAISLNNSGIDSNVLQSPPSALEEVLVIGYGVTDDRLRLNRENPGSRIAALPMMSLEKFKAYIMEKIDSSGFNLEEDQTVVLSFMVDRDGQPGRFRVEQPAHTQALNKLMVEVVRSGPRWQMKADKPRRVILRIIVGKGK